MTKKSYGRQMRDQQKKNETAISADVEKFNGRVKEVAGKDGWEALTKAYCNIVEVCAKHLPFAEVIHNKELMDRVDNRSSLLKKIHQMMTDLTRINNMAMAEYKKHEGRTGDWGDDWIEAVPIMETYNSLLFEYQSLVAPVAASVTEIITRAEIKWQQDIQAAEAAASAQDTSVNVVSEVTFTETAKGA